MMTFLGATLLCRRTCVSFSQLNCCDHTYRNSLSSSFLFLSHFFHSCISSHLNSILIPFFHSTLLSYLDVIYHQLTFILSSSLPSSLLDSSHLSSLILWLLFHLLVSLRWSWRNCSQRCIGLYVPNFYKPLL